MVLDDFDPEEKEEIMVQISARARNVEDSSQYKIKQCEECGADICVSDEYAMEINTDEQSVKADPEDVSYEDMAVFLCQICGMELIEQESGSGVAM